MHEAAALAAAIVKTVDKLTLTAAEIPPEPSIWQVGRINPPTRLENLQFAQFMLKEIRRRAAGEEPLTYLLDMAAAEAAVRAKAVRFGNQ